MRNTYSLSLVFMWIGNDTIHSFQNLEVWLEIVAVCAKKDRIVKPGERTAGDCESSNERENVRSCEAAGKQHIPEDRRECKALGKS